MGGKWGYPPPFFWKYVKRKGFKSFVLKVCETKGVADAFLVKCVNLKELTEKSLKFRVRVESKGVQGTPPPPGMFFVSADAKGLSVRCSLI